MNNDQDFKFTPVQTGALTASLTVGCGGSLCSGVSFGCGVTFKDSGEILVRQDIKMDKLAEEFIANLKDLYGTLPNKLKKQEEELNKLRGFYDEIVKEVGHDCILSEWRDMKWRLEGLEK